MKVVLKDLDNTRIRYEAMVQKLGERDANLIFARALTKEGSKSFTAVKKALLEQTGIPKGTIAGSMKFRRATRKNLQTIISGSGSELPLSLFKPSEFSYGVRAKVWNRPQFYRSAFIVSKYEGNVFHRTNRQRFPIQKMFGPSIPKEMVKGQTIEAFEQSGNAIMARAMHELTQLLRV